MSTATTTTTASNKVHRPYLDKMSTRTSTPSLSRCNSNKNVHILPDLLHTGLMPSCRQPSPPVMLPDGSLNKVYLSSTYHQNCREVNRDVIELESRALSFKTKSVKRINRSLNKLLEAKNLNDTAMSAFMERTIHSPLSVMKQTTSTNNTASNTTCNTANTVTCGTSNNNSRTNKHGAEFMPIPYPTSTMDNTDGGFNTEVFEKQDQRQNIDEDGMYPTFKQVNIVPPSHKQQQHRRI